MKVHCYVLTENHFHLVATTPEGNLSKWIHQLKTAYTVYLNRRLPAWAIGAIREEYRSEIAEDVP